VDIVTPARADQPAVAVTEIALVGPLRRTERDGALRAQVAGLPPDQRTVVEGLYLTGHDEAALCEQLELAAEQVAALHAAALRALRTGPGHVPVADAGVARRYGATRSG